MFQNSEYLFETIADGRSHRTSTSSLAKQRLRIDVMEGNPNSIELRNRYEETSRERTGTPKMYQAKERYSPANRNVYKGLLSGRGSRSGSHRGSHAELPGLPLQPQQDLIKSASRALSSQMAQSDEFSGPGDYTPYSSYTPIGSPLPLPNFKGLRGDFQSIAPMLTKYKNNNQELISNQLVASAIELQPPPKFISKFTDETTELTPINRPPELPPKVIQIGPSGVSQTAGLRDSVSHSMDKDDIEKLFGMENKIPNISLEKYSFCGPEALEYRAEPCSLLSVSEIRQDVLQNSGNISPSSPRRSVPTNCDKILDQMMTSPNFYTGSLIEQNLNQQVVVEQVISPPKNSTIVETKPKQGSPEHNFKSASQGIFQSLKQIDRKPSVQQEGEFVIKTAGKINDGSLDRPEHISQPLPTESSKPRRSSAVVGPLSAAFSTKLKKIQLPIDGVNQFPSKISLTPSHQNPASESSGPNQSLQSKELVYPDGSVYKGTVCPRLGIPEGLGELTLPSGARLEGQWVQGLMAGEGKLIYPSGEIGYQGGFLGGKFHGYGIMYRQGTTDKLQHTGAIQKLVSSIRKIKGSGARYETAETNKVPDPADLNTVLKAWTKFEGTFQNDLKQGIGVLQMMNGDAFLGEFSNDMANGPGSYQKFTGEKILGLWKDNLLVYEFQKSQPDGYSFGKKSMKVH